MKSILISIQPKWCDLIARGEKTIEVRKTRPKIKTPFKCYIYCTKEGNMFFHGGIGEKQVLFFNPDTKEYKFDYAFELMCCKNQYTKDNFLSGKVIGEFVCDKIVSTSGWRLRGNTGKCAKRTEDEEKFTCLSFLKINEIVKYAGSEQREIYGWHISNIKIYDKPKELDMFRKPCSFSCEDAGNGKGDCSTCGELNIITRAPQSWCYVEELQ